MSKKEDTKQEEINTAEEIQQVEDNQEVVAEVAEEVPTAEALLLAEKDKFCVFLQSLKNYKKRTTRERVELFKTAGQEVMTSYCQL